MATATATAAATYEIDHEESKRKFEQRSAVSSTLRTRARHQREYNHNQSQLWYPGYPEAQFAPKWRRHDEEYVNPHLLPHERPVVAPRYGGDAPCRQVRPRAEKCRCEYCLSWYKKDEDKRDAQKALKKIVQPSRAGKGPWVDWDWNGSDCAYSYDGDADWLLDYEDEKQAPAAEIDLLAIAKPAKGKKRLTGQTALRSVNRPFLMPLALPDIDEISILDFEETWEHLDLDHLDLSALTLDGGRRPTEPDEGSEWDWDRCSQF